MPRRCIDPKCDMSPIYNYPDETSRIYCRKHKKDGMVAVGQPRCKECGIYAVFNYPGETRKINFIIYE